MWELDYKESWALKNWCFWTVVLEKILESPLDCKEIQPVNLKGNQSWLFIGRTDAEVEIATLATWCEELTPWKRSWCWERFKAGGEGDIRGWDDWMASLTRRTWVGASSGCWWWTGKLGMLQSMGLQRVGYDWMTELNLTECEANSTCVEYLLNLNVLSKLWKHRQSKFWCSVFLKPFQRKTEFLEIWLSLLAPSEPVGCSYIILYSLFLSLTNTHTSSYRRKYIHIKYCKPSVLLYSYEHFGLWNTALSDNMKHPEADSR